MSNDGELEHEFIVGDEEVQAAHETAMREGDAHMEDDAMGDDGEMMEEGEHAPLAAVTLDPGETEVVTITFDEAASLEYACHVTGHYAAGMKGTLTVS